VQRDIEISNRVATVLATAVFVTLGVAALRTLIPSLVFLLGDRFDWSTLQIAGLAFIIFATAFLLDPIQKQLKIRGTLIALSSVIAGSLLVLNLWKGDPVFGLVFSILAVVAFVLAVPSLYIIARGFDGGGEAHALGAILGCFFDTVVTVATRTYPFLWLDGYLVLMFLIGISFVLGFSLKIVLRIPLESAPTSAPTSAPLSWSWIIFGPYLFLHIALLSNVARFSSLAGSNLIFASVVIFTFQLSGLATALIMCARSLPNRRILFSVILLFLIVMSNNWPSLIWATVQLLVGNVVASGAFVFLISRVFGADVSRRTFSGNLVYGASLLLFLFFLFLEVSRFTVDAGSVSRYSFLLLAVAIAFPLVLASKSKLESRKRIFPLAITAIALAAAIFSLALVSSSKLKDINLQRPGYPLKIMTFNIHCGVGALGRVDLAAIAEEIRSSGTDIVALQEVTRGWVINGGIDTLLWLADYLNMHYVFTGYNDSSWGIAILSKTPIEVGSVEDLPSEGILINRKVLEAHFLMADGSTLNVLNTHFHHLEEDPEIRDLQARSLLEIWNGRRSAVILGDLNSQPDSAQIRRITYTDLVDTEDESWSPGQVLNTYPALAPKERIDYVFLSADLAALSSRILPSLASDHFGVLAEIGR